MKAMRVTVFIVAVVVVLGSTAWRTVAAPLPAGSRRTVEGPGEDRAVTVERVETVSFAGGRFPVLADGTVAAMVELDEEPAVPVWARERARLRAAGVAGAGVHAVVPARQRISDIEQAQQSLVAMMRSPDVGGRVLFRLQRVYDGIAVQLDPATLGLVASLPGVKAVHPLPVQRLQNSSAIPLIGAPQVWSSSGLDVRGDGISIGIIDTGIDYIHTDFGGSGDYTGQVYDDDTVPWTAKVVGGYDFAGDDYDPNSDDPAKQIPHPDGDPMDCEGHGTHVAGIAAGYGVTGSGNTYHGPYGPGTDFGSLRIGPGVAPGARLYALKVFGCADQTTLTAQAIEWAVDPNGDGDFSDHLDVINLSLGYDFGTATDYSTQAADAAAEAGVLVACAAGNDGDTYYVTTAPGTASRALSVASSVDSTSITPGFRVDSPASVAGVYPSLEAAFGPGLAATGNVVGTLVYPSDNADACESFAPAAATGLSGNVALVDRGTCTFKTKVYNCQQAGATAVVVANNVVGSLIVMADDPDLNVTITIPSIFTTQEVGTELKGAMAGGDVAVTLTAASFRFVDPSQVDTLSDFSARGPRSGNTAVKPDLTAPGDTIFSALAGSGNEGVSESGTSMASPMAAGSLALLRQLHPDWSVEEIKALLMNTADHDLYSGSNHGLPVFGPARVGAGRIDDVAAGSAEAVAVDAGATGQVGITFGAPEVLGDYSSTHSVLVVNKGPTAKTFTLSSELTSGTPGVAYSFPDGGTVTVAPGASTSFRVRMTADATQLRHDRAPTLADTQDGQPRSWLSEEAGFLTLTPAAGQNEASDQPLRLPLYASPRPASMMTVTEGQVTVGGVTTSGALHLSGAAVDTGTSYPTDIVSLVSAFELQIVDPDEPTIPTDDNMNDIAYVGVASDYPARVAAGGGLADTVIEFAITAYGDWSTPGETGFRIDIDSNRDGTTDYQVFAETYGDLTGSAPSDVFISSVCPASNGDTCYVYPLDGIDPTQADVALYNTNVMVLPVRASRLGLSAASPRFNYTVHSFGTYDTTVTASYDPTAPGLALYGTSALPTLYLDLDGNTIPFVYNQANYTANASKGVLVLHHHNPSGARVQVLDVVSSSCFPSCTASVPASAAVGEYVTFSASATTASCGGSGVYDWDFGDGSSHATLQSPAHAYAAAGSYAWKLTVSAGGSTCVRTGVITARSATAGSAYVVGGVAHNAGELGSQWRTGAAVVNRSPYTANLVLTYYGTTGTVEKTLALATDATVTWSNVVEELFGLSASAESQGTLHVTSDEPLAITARTYNQSASGTFGQYLPALTTSDAITGGQTGVLPGLRKSAEYRTNVGFVNLGSESCPAVVTLYDASGAQTGNTGSFTVEAGRWSQENDIFSTLGAPASDLAYATVQTPASGCAIWAYASVTDNATQDPTTIPILVADGAAVSAPAAELYVIGGIAHNRGANDSQWRTDVAAVNRSSQAAEVTLDYLPVSGASLTRSVTVAPGAAVQWRNVLEALFDLAPTAESQGTLQIASNVQLFAVGRTYNQSSTGTFGQYLPALRAVDGLTAGQVGVLPQLADSAAFRTNVGAVNIDGPPCQVVVTLYDASGGPIGVPVTLTVASGRWLQQSDIFAAAGHTAADVEAAYATVEAVTAGSSVWFYASVADNRTNDPTTIQVKF